MDNKSHQKVHFLGKPLDRKELPGQKFIISGLESKRKTAKKCLMITYVQGGKRKN